MEAAVPAGTAIAVSWDAALAARLPAPLSAVRAPVHSRHRHVINVVLPGSQLVALASDELDDAPWTVRLAGWAELEPLIGSSVVVSRDALHLGAGRTARLDPQTRWFAPPVDLTALAAPDLAHARDLLGAAVREPTTPFGRASAQLIHERTATLRTCLLADADGTAPAAALTAAVVALIGLGEGLTPSGDDIVTGLAFLSAQPGMRLGARLDAIRRAVADAAHRTTLLSAITMAAAVDGRGRHSFHDLAAAIVEGRPEPAVPAVLAIGHASGSDLLKGMSLALDVESELRAQRDNDKGYCNE